MERNTGFVLLKHKMSKKINIDWSSYFQDLNLYINGLENDFPRSFISILRSDLQKETTYRMSLGKMYLLLTMLSDQKTSTYAKNKIAVRIDVLFLLSDYIDDFLDKDSHLNLKNEDLVLNCITLLFSSMEELCKLIKDFADVKQVIFFLTKAIKGEQKDYYSYVTIKTTIESYFSNMVNKSTSLIQLVCYLALPEKKFIWSEFAQYLGTSFQLQNDAFDSLDIYKSDLCLFKETLPLIKAIEYATNEENTKFLEIIKDRNQDIDSLQYMADFIKDCGAFEFTIEAGKIYFAESLNILRWFYSDEQEKVALIEKFLKGEPTV